jgi:Reverse transcriptase-like
LLLLFIDVRSSLSSPAIIADIHLWHTQLSTEFCGSIITKPPDVSPLEYWVDTSSSWGIGIVFNNVWDAWKLRPRWNKDGHNIGWAEIVAIELGILFAVHLGHTNIHFLIKSDNQGVIHAIERGRSRNSEQNQVLQQITSLLSQHSI